MVDILGDEYRGKTYTEYYSACGSTGGPHEAHRLARVHRLTFVTKCRKCGMENRDG